MKRVVSSRCHHVDLLRRRPVLDPVDVDRTDWEAARRVDQLQALLRLVERGLLSAEEFEVVSSSAFGTPSNPGPATAAGGTSQWPPPAS